MLRDVDIACSTNGIELKKVIDQEVPDISEWW
jgi:hypothetical protein